MAHGVPGLAITHGARDIDSTPPATTTSASPVLTAMAALATAVRPAGAVKVTVHGILTSGSSRHGKLRRAALGSCWVNTYQRSSTSWRNVPTVQKSATGAV